MQHSFALHTHTLPVHTLAHLQHHLTNSVLCGLLLRCLYLSHPLVREKPLKLKDNCLKLQAKFGIALQYARTWSVQFLSVVCNEGFDFRLLPVWQCCKLPSYLWHVECWQQEVPETSYKIANISIFI